MHRIKKKKNFLKSIICLKLVLTNMLKNCVYNITVKEKGQGHEAKIQEKNQTLKTFMTKLIKKSKANLKTKI